MAEKVPEEALGQTWAFGVGVLEKLKPRLGQEVGGSDWGQNMEAAFLGRGNGVNKEGNRSGIAVAFPCTTSLCFSVNKECGRHWLFEVLG